MRFSAFSDDYLLMQEYDSISGFAHPDIPVIESEEPNKIHFPKFIIHSSFSIPCWINQAHSEKNLVAVRLLRSAQNENRTG